MSFSASSERVEEIHQPQTNSREPLRFPLALKQARLAKQLKQETLAAQLHVKLRTLVSWETGTRIPSIGMVALLSHLLTEDFDLKNELVLTYIVDDLTRQARGQEDEQFRRLALHAREQVRQFQVRGQEGEREQGAPLPLFENQPGGGQHEYSWQYRGKEQQEQHYERPAGEPLQQLFTVLDTLRSHSELIPVVRDFLHEVTMQNEQ